MESLEENKPLAGGNSKIEEYVNRIKGGESKDAIFQGLPESFKSGIEQRLAEPMEEKAEQGINEIPPQYRGLDSETLDFIWTFPEYVNPEKTREMQETKARALAALREKESAEIAKTERHQAEQEQIEELRKQLGVGETLGNTETQGKPDFGGDEQLEGIYDTMQNIAGGAKEGLSEDAARKIQKYVDEIKSGKDKGYVLQGLPDKWKKEVEDRLQKTEQEKPAVDSKTESLLSRIGKYKVSLPNIDTLIANEGGDLEVIVNSQKIDFDKFIVLVDPPTNGQRYAVVSFVEKKNKTENPGIGLPIYLELAKRLQEKGITLVSSGAQYAQGQSIWMNLATLGYATRTNGQFEFKNNESVNKERGQNINSLEQIEQEKKDFSSLNDTEIESFIKTLPRMPVAEGSRFTTIDKALLPTQNGASLKVGDKVYTSDGHKQVTGEVISKDRIGGVTLKLSDGRNFSTIPNLTDTYLLEDIKKIYENRQ